MSVPEDVPQPENGFYVLVTGANSGVGLAIGCRLIDEFLQTHPQTETLVLIITTRDQKKGNASIATLRKHYDTTCRNLDRSLPGMRLVLERRVHFRQEIVDLTSLVSVQKVAKRIRATTPKLDAVIFNAGIGGWTGVNWPSAIWTVLTDIKNATTWPTFKVGSVGWATRPQLPASVERAPPEEPQLGEVFCANVFGHYLLGHYLGPLLACHDKSDEHRGRMIWVSSLAGYTHNMNFDDFQGLATDEPYEVSKRITDLLALTSTLPAAASYVDRYLDYPRAHPGRTTRPRIYAAHPGITATGIMPLRFTILEYAMVAAMYIARWLGSQWHPITIYKGATAMVWLALASQSMLDSMEEKEGVGKWGSAADWWGRERAERTEVEGWGGGGRMGEWTGRKGRSPYAKSLTEEAHAEFEEQGVRCWKEMERLRKEWEERLEAAGVNEM
ncbi:NAD(P)-binding protein [Amniculicola lignicola CBS 123094]|uniref:NAD(P)-binding protein n=1 Tax=Amniculicola lignicola CBS 123094 TaxID=1392246 RepID=A0A6A5WBH7_9PLEO|nr:NAD(P)-binding protein [Amniculicola lignicola CBS 123094]